MGLQDEACSEKSLNSSVLVTESIRFVQVCLHCWGETGVRGGELGDQATFAGFFTAWVRLLTSSLL